MIKHKMSLWERFGIPLLITPALILFIGAMIILLPLFQLGAIFTSIRGYYYKDEVNND